MPELGPEGVRSRYGHWLVCNGYYCTLAFPGLGKVVGSALLFEALSHQHGGGCWKMGGAVPHFTISWEFGSEMVPKRNIARRRDMAVKSG